MPLRGADGVRKAIKELEFSANDKLRGVVFQALGNIQNGTPRDTGRAINNWFVSVGAPSSQVTDDTSGNEIKLGDLPDYIIGKTIYFSNNLPYIERLEYGAWSQQAPTGWVRSEISSLKQAVRNI